jgi:predicted RND superfamily exporter protein
MDRYLHARRVLGEPAREAVRYAMTITGPAVLTSTAVLACGFFCLAFSGFQINAWLGLMTAITILVAAVFDLLLLPTMLLVLGGRR